MGKRVIDESFLNIYEDIKIEYPFCYVTPNGKNFFRYLEDGRYEYISFENSRVTLSFGARAQSIESLLEDDNFYFKVLRYRNEIITNEEFEFRRNLYNAEYNKYLEGDKYLASEVQKIIDKENKIYGNNSVVEKQIDSNDLITGNNSPDPF